MSLYSKIARACIRFLPTFLRKRTKLNINVVDGYDKWADIYDKEIEIGNVTVFYNDILVDSLLKQVKLPIQYACDFGAGTGRHYQKIIDLQPKRWVGCDVSPGMLKKLHLNIPEAETHVLADHNLYFAKDAEIDFIFSSLTLGHIKNVEQVFIEWNRVLRNKGKILLTLFHPNLAHLKTARSFKNTKGEIYNIEHYQHLVPNLEVFFKDLNWKVLAFEEQVIDERVKPVLAKNNLTEAYANIQGKAIVCGFFLEKVS